MSLPSWRLVEKRNGRHSHVTVWVGPDADHRANAGTLIVDHEQAEDLFRHVGVDSKRFEIERDLYVPKPGETVAPPRDPGKRR